MKKLIVLAASVAVLALPATGATATTASSAQLHTCSSSYTHAVLSYGHRCLRRGQFCSMGEQRNYRRLGFVCRAGRLY
jgi:hypothetical protein